MNSVTDSDREGLGFTADPASGFFDEMFGRGDQVLPHYRKLAEAFAELGAAELEAKRRRLDLAFLRQGVTFNVYGDNRGAERIFPFDLVPRIIPAREWERLENGLTQRITALNPELLT